MIDYDQTIKNFFADVDAYLAWCEKQTRNNMKINKIQQTRIQWGMISANPQKFITHRYDDAYMLSVDGFMRGDDDSVYLAVCDVLETIREIYFDKQNGMAGKLKIHEKDFLVAYKRWKYQSSKNLFRDFTFPFRSAKSFAIQSKTK